MKKQIFKNGESIIAGKYWIYKNGDINPIGSKQATVTIDGTGWELWKGPHPTG